MVQEFIVSLVLIKWSSSGDDVLCSSFLEHLTTSGAWVRERDQVRMNGWTLVQECPTGYVIMWRMRMRESQVTTRGGDVGLQESAAASARCSVFFLSDVSSAPPLFADVWISAALNKCNFYFNDLLIIICYPFLEFCSSEIQLQYKLYCNLKSSNDPTN